MNLYTEFYCVDGTLSSPLQFCLGVNFLTFVLAVFYGYVNICCIWSQIIIYNVIN